MDKNCTDTNCSTLKLVEQIHYAAHEIVDCAPAKTFTDIESSIGSVVAKLEEVLAETEFEIGVCLLAMMIVMDNMILMVDEVKAKKARSIQ